MQNVKFDFPSIVNIKGINNENVALSKLIKQFKIIEKKKIQSDI